MGGKCGHKGEDDRYAHCQHGCVEYGAAHGMEPVGAEMCGKGDAESRAHSQAEAQYKELHAAGGTHCGKSLCAQVFAHDSRIYKVIELLQEIPQKKGGSKFEYKSEGLALGHAFCHLRICHVPIVIICRVIA